MLVEVNFGLLAKYLLFLDVAFMLFSAQLIYIRDVDANFAFEPDKSLTVLNAKIFFYGNSLLAGVVYFYWLLGQQYLLTLYVVGITAHLVCRITFAYYFYFFLNLANIAGLLCGGYHRYLLWYEMESRSVVSVPAFWNFGGGGEGQEDEDDEDDEDSDGYHGKKKHRKKKKSSKRSAKKRKRTRGDNEDEEEDEDDDSSDDIV